MSRLNTLIPVHQLIEQRAAVDGDRIALCFEGQTLTYAALNQRANQLAHRLRAAGLREDGVVGLFLERSFEMVVGILGILKAGGSYLPLEPSYPPGRIRQMLRQARAGWAVSVRALAPQIHAVDDAHVQWLHVEVNDSTVPDSNPVTALHPDNLSYVIYTSGSTGTPKGCMNSQGALTNRLEWMQDHFQLTPDDVVLQKTPFSFDVSVWEFLWPLIVGAKLVVARPGGHRDPGYLLDLIEAEHVTVVHFVPSMLEIFLERVPPKRCRSLRHVLVAGEAFSRATQERFHRQIDAQLTNYYGPTEACDIVTFWTCLPEHKHRSVPIGSPITGVETVILDSSFESVPDGISGELFVGGAGLGRGYQHEPGLTASRFIPHPTRVGERLYRTGDLARRLEDGALEYLGRVDHQVKVRGFRIELGEVEAALSEHPSVRQVAATVEGQGAEAMLVAHCVLRSREDLGALRPFLLERLPEFMVPTHFRIHDTLPLTNSGKVDRQALAKREAPASTNAHASSTAGPPQNATEAWVIQEWERLLGQSDIQRDDSFFDRGAHSVIVIRCASRVHQHFGVDLPVATFYEAQTPASLAGRIDAALQHHAPDSEAPRFELSAGDARVLKAAGPFSDAFPLTDMQKVMVWQAMTAQPAAFWTDQLALTLHGPVDQNRLESAWRAEVAARPALRTRFAWKGLSEPLQVVQPESPFRLQVVDVRQQSLARFEARVQQQQRWDLMTPFSAGRPPLFRVALVRGPNDRSDLVFTYHHALLDGESARIVLRSVFGRYDGRSPAADAHGESFRLFVERTRAEDLRIDLWSEKLRGSPHRDLGALPLPFLARLRLRIHRAIRPELFRRLEGAGIEPMAQAEGELFSHPLPVVAGWALRRWAVESHVSVPSVWLMLYAMALATEGDLVEVVIGVVLAGREGRSESTVGMLTNVLPLRIRLTPNISARTLAQEIQAGLRELETLSRTPVLAMRRAVEGKVSTAFLTDIWFVSLMYAGDPTWTPPSELRLSPPRALSIASAKLSLLVSSREDQIHVGMGGSLPSPRMRRIHLHVLSLLDRLLVESGASSSNEVVSNFLKIPIPEDAASVKVQAL